MLRELHRVVLAGLFCCAIGSSHVAHAAGLLAAPPADASMATAPQWPVLRGPAQSILGLYGGIVSAYTVSGQLESAALLILPTGYAAPVLGSGSLATFPVAYFDQPQCHGREHLAPSASHPGLLPFPGIVYRSLVSGQPVFIPQGRAPASVQVKSRAHLDAQQGVRCESLEETLPLLAVEPNAPQTTGMSAEGEFGPVNIGIERAPARARQPGRRTVRDAATATGGGQTEAVPDEPQQECSPGCLSEAVGNGFCDVACYFEACSFDGGDCATMNKDEFDKALANMCSPGCNREDIGDGFCDAACRTEACNQDGGDCDSEQQ